MVVVVSTVARPVTTPPDVMVATVGATLPHTPPGVPDVVRVICAPEHTLSKPAITPELGNGLTVTAWVVVALPQLKVDDV